MKTAWLQILVVAFAVIHEARSQRTSCEAAISSTILTATTADTDPAVLNCTVPGDVAEQLVEDSIRWRWVDIAPGNTERILPNISEATYGVMESSYPLSVHCNRSGRYDAFLLDRENDTCRYRCAFNVEVEEVRDDILLEEFSAYPNHTGSHQPTNLTTTVTLPENSILVLVGTCGNRFYLSSGCVVPTVVGQWFKDGEPLFPSDDADFYKYSPNSGELTILVLTNTTTGHYTCVTTLTDGLGSYVTVDMSITLAAPVTRSTPSSITAASTTLGGEQDSNMIGSLKKWEFGVIIVNMIIVIVILLVVAPVVMVCALVNARRRTKDKRRSKTSSNGYTEMTASYKKRRRPRSMLEHIQMEEEEVETIDFGGPAEVPFDCILFEELLHKGAFKIVHHAVVHYPAHGMMGVHAAVKRLRDEKSELGMEELMAEAYTLKAIHEKAGSHPNLISLLGTTTNGGPVCLLLEYVPFGCLDEFLLSLREGPTPDWYTQFLRETLRGAYHKHVSGDLMSILVQVAEGMKFLTEHGFIHRDLSTRNVLIGHRLNVKIANPGMHHEGYYYVVTEREYVLEDMAPECLWEKCHSSCSDVWSFGILAYRVVTLESEPYPDVNINTLYDRIAGGERPQLLASFSNELYFLLQRCWQFVAVERPSFTTIVKDLTDMASKPTRHILLKATEDPKVPGFIDDKGQVFLKLVSIDTIEEQGTVLKKLRRNSLTQRSLSLISSIDDTVYTRETTETMLDLTQSDTDNDATNHFEDGGTKSMVKHLTSAEKQTVDSSDTSNGKEKRGKTDSEALGKGKKRKKKRPSSGKKAEVSSLVENTNSNNFLSVGVLNGRVIKTNPLRNSWESEGDGGVSSIDAPSITEEELDERYLDLSDQSDQSNHGSNENLIVTTT